MADYDIKHGYPVLLEGDHALLTDKDCINAIQSAILNSEVLLVINTYTKIRDQYNGRKLGYKNIGRYVINVNKIVAFKSEILEDDADDEDEIGGGGRRR